MKIIEVYSDIGSIKIYNETMALYLHNYFGDIPNNVIICESDNHQEQKEAVNQIEHIDQHLAFYFFDIHTEAYLSKYDTTETPTYKFKPGHYTVDLYQTTTFLINWHPPLVKVKPYDDPSNLATLPQVSLTRKQN